MHWVSSFILHLKCPFNLSFLLILTGEAVLNSNNPDFLTNHKSMVLPSLFVAKYTEAIDASTGKMTKSPRVTDGEHSGAVGNQGGEMTEEKVFQQFDGLTTFLWPL